jgi:hypothetical protein
MPEIFSRRERPLAFKAQPFVCKGQRQVANGWGFEPVWFVEMRGKKVEIFEHWSVAIVFAVYACKYPQVMKANCL